MRLPVFDENDRSTVDVEKVKEMVDLYKREDYWLTDKITLNYMEKPEDQEPFSPVMGGPVWPPMMSKSYPGSFHPMS